MNSKLLRLSIVAAGSLLIAPSLFAQDAPPKVDFPSPSPACTIKQRVGLTDIEIVYSRPGKKNREIFGGLVPYDKVWRTGANSATKITFSTTVKLNGNDIPAGSYELFTIPGKDEWTVIINKAKGQWGAYQYNDKDDLVRFKTTPVDLAESIETFTIDFNRIQDESAVINLAWDHTVVPIRVEIELTDKLVPQIEAAMSSPDKKSAGFYFQAATFYYNHGQDLHKALDWTNAGLAGNPNIAFELYHLKAQILAKQGDKDGAIAAAKKSSELAVQFEGADSPFVKMNQDIISSLQ